MEHAGELRTIAIKIIDEMRKKGHPEWKSGKDEKHIGKRIRRNQVSQITTIQQYNNQIMSIIQNDENQLFLYYVNDFDRNYFVIGDGVWIVIIGENGIMETSFPPTHYDRYLNKEGYLYLGTIAEVRKSGL